MIYYGLVAIIAVAIIVGSGKHITKYAESQGAKSVINWYMILAIANVLLMLFLLGSYSTLQFKPGPQGPRGARGSQGPRGKDGSCAMCKPDVAGLRPIRPYNRMDPIDPMHPSDMMEQLFSRAGTPYRPRNMV